MEELSKEKLRGQVEEKNVTRLTDSKSLDALLERIGDAHYVLLGEASHGTHEYYTWRTAITKRLIKEKGFNFIAVEGDWPDCYKVNRYVKGYANQHKKANDILKEFQRWPTWMWANWEIAALVSWLKDHNALMPANRRAGFYGLDVYSLWESVETLIGYLVKTDRHAAEIAQKVLHCFERYGKDEEIYAQHSLSTSCREEVLHLLQEIREKAVYYNEDPEASLNTLQNAYIASEAEKYYRTMLSFNDQSWNIRDSHMMETLNRLMEFHGKDTKAIVWEHNTHIGDARYTDMKDAGMLNVGQMVREQYGKDDVVLVGFGSYKGSVLAGRYWNAPVEEMTMPPARQGSFEHMLHTESPEDRLIIFDPSDENTKYHRAIPQRAIGVVYHPAQESRNYVPSLISQRYDAFLYIDETGPLHAIHMKPDGHQVPETYPFEY